MKISNKNFPLERALYGIKDTLISNCTFSGVEDGESALKSCNDITIEKTYFDLRYPLWHDNNVQLSTIEMTENCRAALWYSNNIVINDSTLNGIKVLRECKNIEINNSKITSVENLWKCNNVKVRNSHISGEYSFFESTDIDIYEFVFSGKYSFQYTTNLTIKNANLDTKDAFWHANNVIVEDSVVKGEYLGCYSYNLTFINCKIIGTQPLCYVKNLKLINCEMIDTDFAFEYSDVDANITTEILSIKNPNQGYIKAPSIKEVILDENFHKTGKLVIETLVKTEIK